MKKILKRLLYNCFSDLVSLSRTFPYKELIKSKTVIIGQGTYNVPNVYVYKKVTIGNYTSIGTDVTIITGGIHPINTVS